MSHEIIIGEKYGRLTVLERVVKADSRGKNRTYLTCRCECGTVKDIRMDGVSRGKVQSCGCYCRDVHRAMPSPNKSHGFSETSIHNTWMGIKSRCYNPANKAYPYYGGRGIKVCDRWLNSFEAFYEDMGDKPSPKHSVERIDVNGDYSPENCKWATQLEQAQNKTNNRMLTFEGKTQCLSAWAYEIGVKPSCLEARLRICKLDLAEALHPGKITTRASRIKAS